MWRGGRRCGPRALYRGLRDCAAPDTGGPRQHRVQRDLIVSLVRLAETSTVGSYFYREAVRIVDGLAAAGTLAANDTSMVDALHQRLKKSDND